MNWHYLKPNCGQSLPRRIVVFDCETFPEHDDASRRSKLHRFRLGVALKYRWRRGKPSGVQDLRFTSPDEFWRFVLDGARAKETTWIVAHNALFDLRLVALRGITECGSWVVDKPRIPKSDSSKSAANRGGRALAVIDGPPVILCLRHQESGCKVVCVDTLNWIKAPLAAVGEALGVPKLPMPAFDAPDGEWFTYCDRDVAITAELFNRIIRMVARMQLGNFAKTAAGQAMNAFRHRFIRHKICVHDEPHVQHLERQAFFGGRSECFRLGEHDTRVHQYDVNSLYPSVMAAGRYPTKLDRWAIPHDMPHMAPAIDPSRSVAHVTVQPRRAVYPHRMTNQTVYPLGEFETYLCGEELARAWHNGEIKAWHAWAEYDCQPIFAYAVKQLFMWRQHYTDAGQPIEAKLCKLFANSLFGKFGQRQPRWADDFETVPPDAWCTWSHVDGDLGVATEYRSVGWHVQKQTQQENASGSFIAVAAFVTARGRERMNQLRDEAGPGNVFYQGVDSLVVNDAGRANLHRRGEIHARRLGKLKHVRTAERCALWGVGDYEIGSEQITSGVKSKDVQTGPDQWRGERFLTAAGLFDRRGPDGIEVRTIEYERIRSYSKREVLDDGKTAPLTFQGEHAQG